jgi:uncharacterized protein YcfL
MKRQFKLQVVLLVMFLGLVGCSIDKSLPNANESSTVVPSSKNLSLGVEAAGQAMPVSNEPRTTPVGEEEKKGGSKTIVAIT